MMLLWLVACGVPGVFDPHAAWEADLAEEQARAWELWQEVLEEELDEAEVPSIAAVVVYDGEIIASTALGTRIQGATSLPADLDTVYRWGSVSKMHTALGMLLAERQGLLSLDDGIDDLLDDFSLADGDPGELTVARLLTHQGAVPDELDWSCDTDADALVDYYEGWNPALLGEPGAYYNYSNSGYNLLGAGLQQTTGVDFPVWMKRQVLEPLGMGDATYLASETEQALRATGHAYRDEGVRQYPLREYDCAVSRPAAWLHGSVEDLGASLAFFLDPDQDLIDVDSVEGMRDQADTWLFPDGSYRVGQGQFSWGLDGYQVVEHDGYVTGFVSEWAIVPEARLGIAVVANAEWADVEGLLLAGLGANDTGDTETDWPPDYSTPIAEHQRFAGTYFDPVTWGKIEVSWSEDGLFADFVDLDHQSALTQRAGVAFRFEDPDGDGQTVRFLDRDTEDAHPSWFVNRYGVGTLAE